MKAVLIPVKDPARGKTRLAEYFTLDERKQLAWAMFEDVARAASGASLPDRVAIVTNFDLAAKRAREIGFDVLNEQAQISESASVDWASLILKQQGFETVIRMPADVPLILAEDIDWLLSVEVPSPGALLVPSLDGTGTNAIVRTPPDVFPSRFGPNSLALHQEEAARAGVACVIISRERIALDIDEPAEISLFMQRGRGTETFKLLSRLNLAKAQT